MRKACAAVYSTALTTCCRHESQAQNGQALHAWSRRPSLALRRHLCRVLQGTDTRPSRPRARPAHARFPEGDGEQGVAIVTKPCPRHPDVPRYPSGGCPVCTDLRQKKRRAAFRKAHPKKLSPRQKALRAGRQFYRSGNDCPNGHRNPLRCARKPRCVECGRSVYPQQLSKQAKERKRLRSRDHSRRRARALRVLNALIGGGITI